MTQAGDDELHRHADCPAKVFATANCLDDGWFLQ
jgi:hypothetical protein